MSLSWSSLHLEWVDYTIENKKQNLVSTLVRLQFRDRVYWILQKNKKWVINSNLASIPFMESWKESIFIIDTSILTVNQIFSVPSRPISIYIKQLIKTICSNLECWLAKVGEEINLYMFTNKIIEWHNMEEVISAIWRNYWLVELEEISTKTLQKVERERLLDECETPRLLN